MGGGKTGLRTNGMAILQVNGQLKVPHRKKSLGLDSANVEAKQWVPRVQSTPLTMPCVFRDFHPLNVVCDTMLHCNFCSSCCLLMSHLVCRFNNRTPYTMSFRIRVNFRIRVPVL
ncbi:hypothetical protein AVEN_209100-1 [Araneus ventricosus]|uniref:Uncharacterized protein n=1 Tax=Araneus ventricosus TaxID=182803 RepID=A0A4Y2MK25_ARAVE|nr:hypothetical protein AVEN_209100-1 [Araneus ventricosus]